MADLELLRLPLRGAAAESGCAAPYRSDMELTTYSDPHAYAARVLPRLAADEARFNLALAVVASLQSGRLVSEAPPLLAVLSDGVEDVAVMHTPPYGLLLTGLPDDGAAVLVDAVLTGGHRPPLVVGPPEAVGPVVEEWSRRTGATVSAVRRQGVYALRELVPPPPPAGEARTADEADRDLVFTWQCDFADELDLQPAPRRTTTDARVTGGDITLWTVDGVPVSLAGIGGRTPRGARVGPVYTPPEHRRKGYAAAVTAAVTRRCLDEGAERCFLYTDLDNPTSNAIYQRLGYEWVTESREVTFADRAV